MATLADLIEEEAMASSLPEAARPMFRVMLDLLAELNGKIADLDKEITRRAREDEVSRRLMTIPGVGAISATAIAALAPPIETFTKGRDRDSGWRFGQQRIQKQRCSDDKDELGERGEGNCRRYRQTCRGRL
ncbi:transposase [Bradyrhizobium sp. GM7.3]